MHFECAVLSSFFIASVVCQALNQSSPVSPVVDSPPLAGVLLSGNFYNVAGTITIPAVQGENSSAVVWVGMSGSKCSDNALRTGVEMGFDGENGPYYKALYQHASFSQGFYDQFTIGPGDVVQLTVCVFSTTGLTVIENITKEKFAFQTFNSGGFCGEDVGWFIQAIVENNEFSPIPDFGTLNFTNALANGTSGSYSPENGTIYDTTLNGVPVANTTVSGTTISIQQV